MPATDKAVVDAINIKLDPRQVIKAIGFRVDSLSQVGSRWKALCPVHRGETFKSLQLDPQTGTAQCIVRECRAHGTISLVELYAFSRHLDPLAGAVELARLFSLSLPAGSVDEICKRFLAQAEAALAVEDFPEAELHLSSALAARPDDPVLAARVAKVKEQSGAVVEALDAWLLAASLAPTPEKKLRIIEKEALRLSPESPAALRLAAETRRRQSPEDPAWIDFHFRAVESLLKQRQYKDAAADLATVEDVLEREPRFVFLKAEALIGLTEMDDALQILYAASDDIEKRGEAADTLRLYELLLRLEPDNDDIRERVAEFRAVMGDTETYLREIQKLAQNALARKDTARAGHLFATLLKRDPDHAGAHEGIASIAGARGDRPTEYEHLAAAFSSCQLRREKARLPALLRRLIQTVPDDPQQLSVLAERAAAVDIAAAIELWKRAGVLHLRHGDAPAGEVLLRRAIAAAPADHALLRDAIEAALLSGQEHLAAEWYILLAGLTADANAAVILLNEALEKCGRTEELLAVRYHRLLELCDAAQLRDALDELLERPFAREDFAEAVAMAEAALEACPDEPLLLEKLADVHLIEGHTDQALPILLRIARSDAAGIELCVRAAEQALSFAPRDASTLLLLASLMEQLGDARRASIACEEAADVLQADDPRAAFEALTKASTLRPDHAELLHRTAAAALALGERETARLHFRSWIALLKEPKAIRDAYEEVNEALPGDPDHALAFAEWLAARGEVAAAVAVLIDCIQLLVAADQTEEALPLLDRSLTLDEINVGAYRERAEIHLRHGRLEEAAADWRRVIHLASTTDDPGEAIAACERLASNGLIAHDEFTILSELHEQLGNHGAAADALERRLAHPGSVVYTEEEKEAVYRRILELDHLRSHIRIRLGHALLAREQKHQAAEEFEEAARRLIEEEERDQARTLLSLVKEFEPARYSPREILVRLLRGSDEEAYKREALELAALAASLSDQNRSRDVLHALAVDLDGDAEIIVRLAEAHESLSELEEAERLYMRAASIREAADELDSAIELLRRALRIRPENVAAREQLATLLRRSELHSDAREEYIALLRSLLDRPDDELAPTIIEEYEAISVPVWEDYQPLVAVLEEKGRTDFATVSLRRVLAQSIEARKYTLSRLAAEKLLGYDPENNAQEESYAEILIHLGEDDAAEAALLRVLSRTKKKRLPVIRRAHKALPNSYAISLAFLRELTADSAALADAADLARRLVAVLNGRQEWERVAEVSALMIKADDSITEFHFGLAEALFETAQNDEAVTVLRSFTASRETREPAEARRALEYLLDYLPDSADDLANLYKLVIQSEGELAARPLQARTLNLYASTIDDVTEFRKKSQELIASDPDNHELHRRFAELLHERGLSEDALREFKSLSAALQSEKQFTAALMVLQSAHALFPDDMELLASLADMQEHTGDLPESAHTWTIIADRLEDALPALENVVRLDPANRDCLARLVAIHRERNASDKEVAVLNQLMAANEGRKEKEKNIPLLERLIELDEANAALREQHAELLHSVGRDDDSLEQRRLHIDLLRRAGRFQEAIASARRGLLQLPDRRTLSDSIIEISGEAGDLRSLAAESESQAKALYVDGDAAAALATLVRAAKMLLDHKGEPLILKLLDAFGPKVEDVPELVRTRALALEAEGNDVPASAAWRRLGSLHCEGGNPADGEAAWRRAISLDPRDIALRRDLIELLAASSGREAELVAELRELARLLEVREEFEAANELYEQILGVDTKHREALSRSAALLVKMKRLDEAADIGLRIARICLDEEDTADARAAFEEVLAVSPDNPHALRGLMQISDAADQAETFLLHARRLASFFDRHHALEDANSVYREICRRDPSDEESCQRLADYFQQTGEIESAAEYLRRLYRLYSDAGNLPRSIDVLHRIEKIDPENPETSELLGRLYITLHDEAQASAYLMAAAKAHAQAGNAVRALKVSEEIIALDPRLPEVRELRVGLFMERGSLDLAAEELIALADYYRDSENSEKELETLLKVLETSPANTAVIERHALLLSDLDRVEEAAAQFLRLSRILAENGDLAGASDAVSTACTLAPDHVPSHEHAAELYLMQSDFLRADNAIQWLARHYESEGNHEAALAQLKRSPSLARDPDLLFRSARLEKVIGRTREAKSSIHKMLDLSKGRADAEAKGREFLFELDPTDLRSLHLVVDAAIAAGRNERAEDLYLLALEALLASGEIDAARALVEEGFQKCGQAVSFRRKAAQVYNRSGIPELAAVEFAAIARTLRDEEQFEAALEEVSHALALRGDDPSALDLRFDLLCRLDRQEEAFSAAEDILGTLAEGDASPRAEEILREMVRLRPRDAGPRLLLIDALERSRNHGLLSEELRALAELYMQQEDLQNASDVLSRLLAIRPDDTRARIQYIDAYKQFGPEIELVEHYMRLADVYTRDGCILEATRLYEKMLDLAPSRNDIRERFIHFLLNNSQATRALTEAYVFAEDSLAAGNAKGAIALLEKLRSHATGDPQFFALAGRAQLTLNARGSAAKELRRAAELHLEAGNRSRQSEVLRELLKIDPLNLEIRQALIEALLASGNKADALDALDELATRYIERGLADLAEVELRKALAIDSERPSAWRLLFVAAQTLVPESQLVQDYVEYAEMMARRGEVREAIDYYIRVVELDPRNIRAHRGYVTQYPKVGRLRDIVNEILSFAQILVEEGEVDEASRYFELVMSFDPNNSVAREMLSATQSRAESSQVRRRPDATPARGPDSTFEGTSLSETQKSFIRNRSTVSASDYLAGEMEELDHEESSQALSQVVANYRHILAVNSQAANVRVKLADVLEQMGRIPEMLTELEQAAESYFAKSELNHCIRVCERYLALKPADGRIRKRLNEAIVKQDAISALESAILYTNRETGRLEKQ